MNNMDKGKEIPLFQILHALEALVLTHNDFKKDDLIRFVAAGDLMSDLLRIPYEGVILITGLNSIQAVRTCAILGIKALIIVRGKQPDKTMIVEAERNNILLARTKYSMFSSCGRLYALGLRGIP